jgi:hypothetical protein
MLGRAMVLRRPAALHKRGVVIASRRAPAAGFTGFTHDPHTSEIFTHDDASHPCQLRRTTRRA